MAPTPLHFSHDAVGCNNSHVPRDAGTFTFVDIDDARLIAATGANHLGGDSLGDVLFLECQKSLQAMCLGRVLAETDLLQPHLFDLLLKLAVLGPNSAQVDIVVPDTASAVADPDQPAFKRTDRPHRPDADQAGIGLTAAALHLHGKPEHL
jgi:hypothetical protein